MSNILQQFLDGDLKILEERAKAQLVRVTRQTKIMQRAGGLAMKMARDNKDPLYFKYSRLNKKRIRLKQKLMMKYSKRSIALARSLS